MKKVTAVLFLLTVIALAMGYNQSREIGRLNARIDSMATTTKVVEFLTAPDENGITGFTKAVYESNLIISKAMTASSSPKK